jgi:hypothetical protein
VVQKQKGISLIIAYSLIPAKVAAPYTNAIGGCSGSQILPDFRHKTAYWQCKPQ